MKLLRREQHTPPVTGGRHRSHTPEAWRRLTEDLDGAASSMALLDQELAAVREQLAQVTADLAAEQWVRGLQDDLIGRLVRARDNWEAQTRNAYTQLADVRRAFERSTEVVKDLRERLNGGTPPETEAVRDDEHLRCAACGALGTAEGRMPDGHRPGSPCTTDHRLT